MIVRSGDRVCHPPTGFEGMVIRTDDDQALVQPLCATACCAEWFPASELWPLRGQSRLPRLRDVSAPEKGGEE